MKNRIEPERLSLTPDGTPYSKYYEDVYHSAAGGHEQAQHVFLAGNGLPGRWQDKDSYFIFETGFGLGLNFMATWLAWKNDPKRCRSLQFISVEKHPFAACDLALAHKTWPEFSELSAMLFRAWPPLETGEHQVELENGQIILRLIFGDAVKLLPVFADINQKSVDTFYLDGFSPAKNPELWSTEIFKTLANLARPGATLATWSVAGHVRHALSVAGFTVDRRSGFADKRQMLVGQYISDDSQEKPKA